MTRSQTALLIVSGVLAAVSAAVYAWARYLAVSTDPFAAYNHPVQPWALAAHVLATPALLFGVGWIWQGHIREMRRDKSVKRGLGSIAYWLFVPMAASGYLLQVVTAEAAHLALVWVHAVSGTVFSVAFFGHAALALGRTLHRARGARPRTVSRLGEGRPEEAPERPQPATLSRAARVKGLRLHPRRASQQPTFPCGQQGPVRSISNGVLRRGSQRGA